MQAFISDLLTFLSTLPTADVFGAGLVANRNLFAHVLPPEAADCLLLSTYSTRPPDSARDAYYPAIQIIVRHESAACAYDTAQLLINTLHRNTRIFPATLCLSKQSLPFSLGKDDKGGSRFAVNFAFSCAGKLGTP